MGCITSSAKSLNILRQALQFSINKEINEVIQKYLDKFFRPAIENIRTNNGANSVSDQHVQAVCRQILEEAKKMYYGGISTRANSPITTGYGNSMDNLSDNENNPMNECRTSKRRVKDSDSDSETSSFNTLKPVAPRKKRAYHRNTVVQSSGRSTPVKIVTNKQDKSDGVKREGPKWDSSRLTTETRFVLGSKANKALGFGSTRGRLYTKHADLFRYIGDQDDKQWLHDNHLMPPAGGRAYLLVKDDILDLINSDEYRNAPGVNANDMGEGFTVPEKMIIKMRRIMSIMRNSDASRKKIESKSKIGALNPPLTASTNIMGDNSSTGSGVDISNQTSVETIRPGSGAVSPADDVDLMGATETPSVGPSPFSVTTSCFDCDASPTARLSPITSDVSPSTNDL